MSGPGRGFAVAVAAASLAAVLVAANAAADAAPSAPSISYARGARGPLALLVATDADGPHAALDTCWPLGRSAIGASAPGPGPASRLGLEGMAVLTARPGRDAPHAGDVSWSLRLERAAEREGRWLGMSLGGAPESDGTRVRGRAGVGTWRWLAPFELEAACFAEDHHDARWARLVYTRLRVGPDTIAGVRDTFLTTYGGRSVLRTTGQGALRWRHGRFELETVGGITAGRDLAPHRWLQGSARLQLSRRWLLVASVGDRAGSSLAFDANGQPRTMVGVQYAPGSSARWAMADALRPVSLEWRTRVISPARVLVRVRCRDTRRVELAGDFSDWQPVTLLPVHANWWAAVLPIETGLHRVRVRLDGGEWVAPAGLPRSIEGPGGPAGLLVIE